MSSYDFKTLRPQAVPCVSIPIIFLFESSAPRAFQTRAIRPVSLHLTPTPEPTAREKCVNVCGGCICGKYPPAGGGDGISSKRVRSRPRSSPTLPLGSGHSWGGDRCRGRVQTATTRWRGRFRGREFPGTGSTGESPQGNVNHQGPQTTRDISFDHPTNAMSISCNCRLSSCVCDEYYGSARTCVCVCARGE